MMNIEEIRHLYQDTINGNEGIRVSVAVALVNRKDEILLERRKDSGWWGITGGKLEAGETITECGIRELQEETGYLIKETQEWELSMFGPAIILYSLGIAVYWKWGSGKRLAFDKPKST